MCKSRHSSMEKDIPGRAMNRLGGSENSVVQCGWNRRWEVRSTLSSAYAAKKQNSRRPWFLWCFSSTVPFSLRVKVLQTAGPEGEPMPPLSWRCTLTRRSLLGEVSWRTDMLSWPFKIPLESQGGEGRTARPLACVRG